MYLEVRKSGNKTYMYAKQKYRDPETKKILTQSIANYGAVEDQQHLKPDPITYYKNIVKNLNEENKKEQVKNEVSVNINLNESIPKGYNKNSKNLGSLFISYIFDKLNLSNTMYALKDKEEYSLAQILRFLVYTRILYPGSKLDNYSYINNFIDKFDFKLHHIYRALKVFAKHKSKIINELHQFLSYNFNIDKTYTHYDVTNFYIYTDADNSLDDDEIVKYGYSKVNNGKPIVQMGLITDRNRIPLTYKIFPGNTNDVSTLIPFIEEAKKEFNFSKTVLIADAGLISSNNIAEIIVNNNSYIIKDRIRNMNKILKNMFEKTIKPTLIAAFENEVRKSDDNKKEVFTYGISISNSKRTIQTIDKDGKSFNKSIIIPERYIFIYSPKYERLKQHNRQEKLENEENKIKNNKINKTKFFKENILVVNAENGVIEDKNFEAIRNYEIDNKAIEEDAKYDGFSLIVTNLDPKDNIDSHIVSMYANQYKIEQAFRTTKSLLKSRPIYLSTKEAIEGHFLTCFLSLLTIELISQKLNHSFSLETILETLKKHNYVHEFTNVYLIDSGGVNDCLHKLYENFELNDIKFRHTPNSFKNLLAKTRD